MAEVLINFDMGRLSDRMLNLLLRGAGEGDRPKDPYVRELYDVLIAEKLCRQGPRRIRELVRVDVPAEDPRAIAAAIGNLFRDLASLEFPRAIFPAGSPEREEYAAGADLLLAYARGLRTLYPQQEAAS